MNFKLFWVDFDGLEVEFATVKMLEDLPSISSYNGNVWNLKNSECGIFFSLGERLFEKSDCKVLVSDMMGEYM